MAPVSWCSFQQSAINSREFDGEKKPCRRSEIRTQQRQVSLTICSHSPSTILVLMLAFSKSYLSHGVSHLDAVLLSKSSYLLGRGGIRALRPSGMSHGGHLPRAGQSPTLAVPNLDWTWLVLPCRFPADQKTRARRTAISDLKGRLDTSR
jgi:hypothetical protein